MSSAGFPVEDILTISTSRRKGLPPRTPDTDTSSPPVGATPPAAASIPETWPPAESTEYRPDLLTSPITDTRFPKPSVSNMFTCGLTTKPPSLSICAIFPSAAGRVRPLTGTEPMSGYPMTPDSDTRTSRLKSGFLNTLIFKISPGTKRYSGCARAGAAPNQLAHRRQNARRFGQRPIRPGCRWYGFTAAWTALIFLCFLLVLDPTKEYFKCTPSTSFTELMYVSFSCGRVIGRRGQRGQLIFGSNRRKHVVQNGVALEVLFRKPAPPAAQCRSDLRVVREPGDRARKFCAVFRCHHHAAFRDNFADFRPRTASRNHRPAAGQHAGQFRRQHQICCVGTLRQQMNVCHPEHVRYPPGRLQRHEFHIGQTRCRGLQLRLHDPIAANDKHDVAARFEESGRLRYHHQSLLAAQGP